MSFAENNELKKDLHSILVAYFSVSGNTYRLAESIQREAGGDTFRIRTEQAYPQKYEQLVARARDEIRSGYFPVLQASSTHLEGYYAVFVGSPNWWGTIAPPVAAFLATHDFSGKVIVPFCTHGGSGGEQIKEDIMKLCPEATVMSLLEVYGPDASKETTRKTVVEWLRNTGMTR